MGSIAFVTLAAAALLAAMAFGRSGARARDPDSSAAHGDLAGFRIRFVA
jgi:hypothetical protein